MNNATPSLAVIDGVLCQLTRKGARARGHAPLATAVVEICPGPLCTYVREHPHGLLPGLPNLYCLDGALRLQWLAEWPEAAGPCVEIRGEAGGTLVALAASGAIICLEAATGRLQRIDPPLAAAV